MYGLKPTYRYQMAAGPMVLLLSALLLAGCPGPTGLEFAVIHVRDTTGNQITQVATFTEYPGLDNSAGTAPLQVQIEFRKPYYYQINERLETDQVSSESVREKIVLLYHLPPNDPEGEEQTALCPLSVVVPAGQKAIITVEWTERWAEGVINEGVEGQGDQLGTYRVFLGYLEPCSLVNQENVQ